MPVAPARPRLSWASIDWTAPLPPGFVLPEELYRFETVPGLIWAQRVRLNHLATCFRFELMLHLKAYVVRYLERHLRRLARRHPERDLPRFLKEQRRHVKALGRVLRKIRPDLYRGAGQGLLAWTLTDSVLVRLVPAATFFTLASLGEEIARAVPDAIDEHPDECFGPILDVLRLQAREERRHIAIDDAVLLDTAASRPAALVKAQVLFTIPLLRYIDRRVRRAWTRAVDRFAEEEGLTREQQRALRDQKPSHFDLLGLRAFLNRRRCRRVPGHAALRRVLQAQLC
ncbi:MAG: hypothetical protein ACYTG3_06850 [Planctomycetota bacterium]|jgi:hypothetical protein